MNGYEQRHLSSPSLPHRLAYRDSNLYYITNKNIETYILKTAATFFSLHLYMHTDAFANVICSQAKNLLINNRTRKEENQIIYLYLLFKILMDSI